VLAEGFLFGQGLKGGGGRSSPPASPAAFVSLGLEHFGDLLFGGAQNSAQNGGPGGGGADSPCGAGGFGGAGGGEARLMGELRAHQLLASECERRLQAARARYEFCLKRRALAVADHEDALLAKHLLCDQLIQVLKLSEGEKYSKMLTAAGTAAGTTAGTDIGTEDREALSPPPLPPSQAGPLPTENCNRIPTNA